MRMTTPKAMTLLRDDAEARTRVTRRWFHPNALFFFAITIPVLEVVHELLFIGYRLMGVALGVFAVSAMYMLAAEIVNRTYVELKGDELRVWHGPLPWPGSMRVKVQALRGTTTQQDARNPKYRSLTLLDVEGAELALLGGLRTEEEARFLEHTIRAHCGLAN
jgi:hypothetical protein